MRTMIIEGFEIKLDGHEKCASTKEEMHESIVSLLNDCDIWNVPFYVFYEDLTWAANASDFQVKAYDFDNYDMLVEFARHLIKTKGVRYSIEQIHTPDDNDFYVVFEDDFK